MLSNLFKPLEGVRIKGESVLSGLNLEKIEAPSYPRDKANCP